MRQKRTRLWAVRTVGAVVACLALGGASAGLGECPQAKPSGDPALHALFDAEWEWSLKEYPTFATYAGDHRYDDRLPSMAPADLERRNQHEKETLAKLHAIERGKLGVQDRISYDMFERQLEDGIQSYEFGEDRMAINADSGFHVEFADLPNEMTFVNARDYDNYLQRLRAWPTYLGQEMALMRAGLKAGFTPPQVVLKGYEKTATTLVVDAPEHSVFWKPFEKFPPGVPEADRSRLLGAARQVIAESVIPGYRRFADFLVKEYIPGCRTTLGASALPNGKEYYAWLVKHHTTLDVTPEQVHAIGLAEVKRIRAEMEQVIRQVGFHGDFKAFLHFLRTDPRFYAKTPEELLMRAAWIAKRMDGKLPSLFKTLPRLPYGVEPVPDYLAPKYTGGRYVEAPVGSTRAGTYWVNTYALESRPLYTQEALTYHEAVPGHHLQIALAQELTDLPKFRRFSGTSAFVEGWALYSEHLGLEAGFYQDPYSNFGRLTYEMWRACRLVVDTGVHAMGWTRQQMMDFLAENTALSLHEIETETDRYISWPGQALAYKMGEIKIRELRAQAEKELGEKFDVREFHDVVLRNGAIPLGILEAQVKDWIAQKKAAG